MSLSDNLLLIEFSVNFDASTTFAIFPRVRRLVHRHFSMLIESTGDGVLVCSLLLEGKSISASYHAKWFFIESSRVAVCFVLALFCGAFPIF